MVRQHALTCIPTVGLSLVLSLSCAAEEKKPVKIIEPKNKNEAARSASIDSEKYQLGFYQGILAVEDFNTNLLSGLTFTYLLNEQFIIQTNYAVSDVGKSTFEEREGLNFLSDEQRKLSYFNLLGGYKLYTARSFLASRLKFDSDVYVLAGLGNWDYADQSNTGISLGMSYRVVFTDWLVSSIDFRDHIYDSRDVFGEADSKTTQNLELSISVNVMF